MPLQGNIRDFSTTQLLNLVNLSRRTGTLTIFEGVPTGKEDAMKNPLMAPGAERARVAFHQGKLVFAALAGQDTGLVALLNKAGKLTDDQARLLRERAKNTRDKDLAVRLINAKSVTQADVVNSIKNHILDVVYNLMGWTEGPFRFDDEMKLINDAIPVPIDLQPVIIEGTRRRKEVEELDKLISDLDVSLRFPENPRDKFKGIHLNVDEWKVVSYVNPKNTVRMIMKQLNMSEVEIKRVIYGLNQAGLVEIVSKTAASTAKAGPGAPAGAAGGRRDQRAAQRKPDAALIGKLIDRLRSM